MNKMLSFYEKNKKKMLLFSTIFLVIFFFLPIITTKRMNINEFYNTKEDVALYIMQYHELPKNFVTKYGKDYMKNHNYDSTGFIMGGDTHLNTGQLSSYGIGYWVSLKECDVAGSTYQLNGNRGAERLVYTCNSEDVRVFYTYDHYETFTELTYVQLQPTRNVFLVWFIFYFILFFSFYMGMEIYRKKHLSNNYTKEDNQIE